MSGFALTRRGNWLASIVALALFLCFTGFTRAGESEILETRGSYESQGKSITIERFEPKTPGKYPAVLVVHGSGGMTIGGPWFRDSARHLAKNGYVAHVVHYFDLTGTKIADLSTMKTHFPAWMTVLADGLTRSFEATQCRRQPSRSCRLFTRIVSLVVAIPLRRPRCYCRRLFRRLARAAGGEGENPAADSDPPRRRRQGRPRFRSESVGKALPGAEVHPRGLGLSRCWPRLFWCDRSRCNETQFVVSRCSTEACEAIVDEARNVCDPPAGSGGGVGRRGDVMALI